jgi:hypothetical protein
MMDNPRIVARMRPAAAQISQTMLASRASALQAAQQLPSQSGPFPPGPSASDLFPGDPTCSTDPAGYFERDAASSYSIGECGVDAESEEARTRRTQDVLSEGAER